jgi:hypothetical protein
MVEETLEAKLKRHEEALSLCIAEIEKLRAENALLRSAEGAHDVLRRLYLDETQSSNVRCLAARAALNVEKPALKPQDPPMDLVGEEIIPLAELVRQRRAYAAKTMSEPPYSDVPKIVSPKGNGSDDSGDAS